MYTQFIISQTLMSSVGENFGQWTNSAIGNNSYLNINK